MHGNTVATPGGSLLACGTFLNNWVAAGHDKGTKSVQWPRDVRLSAAFGCAQLEWLEEMVAAKRATCAEQLRDAVGRGEIRPIGLCVHRYASPRILPSTATSGALAQSRPGIVPV